MTTQYYKTHGGKLTLPECWRIARSWRALWQALSWKPFGGYPFKTSIARPDALEVIDPKELPDEFRERFLVLITLCEKAGLEPVFYHRSQVLERANLGAGAYLLDPTGTVIGTIATVKIAGTALYSALTFTTHFTDGTVGITTTARKTFKPLPHHLTNRYGPVRPDFLYDRHRIHLKWCEQRDSKTPRSFTPQQLPGVVLETIQQYVDFHAARGVFVPMTEDEIARQRGNRLD
jgi:hypothetical protein